jgi:hypothetical protein
VDAQLRRRARQARTLGRIKVPQLDVAPTASQGCVGEADHDFIVELEIAYTAVAACADHLAIGR